MRHELNSGVGNDPCHGGGIPAPQTQEAIVFVGKTKKFNRTLNTIVLVWVGLEVDFGSVERGDGSFGECAGHGSGCQ